MILISFIIKKFVKNYEDIKNPEVRNSYILLSGILGIFLNLCLFLTKFVIGILMNSIAIISDSFNNLSDTLTSFIAIIGAKISEKPADREHPFGHGRSEYIASLIVSVLITVVGVELFKSSFLKILYPEEIFYNFVLIWILILSISVKVYIYYCNKKIGYLINSSMNKGLAKDSLNDILSTSSIIIAIVVSDYFNINIDGQIGLFISCLVIYSGIDMAKETISQLLGEHADDEVVNKIEDIVLSGKYIVGCHDLSIHEYGKGRIFASIHVEAPDNIRLGIMHDIIDRLEERVANELNIVLVIHVDPVYTVLKEINGDENEDDFI